MKKSLFLMALGLALAATSCTTTVNNAPGTFTGADFETIKTQTRPAEIGGDVKDQVITGESNQYSVLGLISWGDDVEFSTPLVNSINPLPVDLPIGSNPLRNAVGDAVNKANVDGIYITHVETERWRLIDFGFITDNLGTGITSPLKPALVPLNFLNGLYERRTVKVTGRAMKVKPLGIVSAERYDASKRKDKECCK